MLYVRDMFSRNFSGFLLKIREFVQMCYSIGTEKCWVLAIIKKHLNDISSESSIQEAN